MAQQIAEVIRGWLGWCPDQQMVRMKTQNTGIPVDCQSAFPAQDRNPASPDPAGNKRNPPYEHTQPGYLLTGAVGAVALFLIVMTIVAGPEPVSLIVLCIMLFVLAIMSRLTVSVSETALHLRFGPVGLVRKEWPLHEIISATPVENPWYYGYGLRFTPHGRLYNVSGRHAVELLLASGTKFRIGTDEPEKLAEAVRNAIR
ncbi:MAG: DUF1673 family protein [Methanomicrobiales archaeon]|nr:DUF1673 family protein [Methanomicrobiales archaeon]